MLFRSKSLYTDTWETFIGNSGVIQAFGNTDGTTCEYLSKRIGQTTIETASLGDVSFQQQMSGQSGINRARINTPLLQPDEIERFFASHNRNQIVLLSGHAPLQLDRVTYFEHPLFNTLYEPDPAVGPPAG